MTEQVDPPIYAALLAVKPPDLSLGRWASDAGLARNYFNGLREHGNPKRDALERLLGVIGVDIGAFENAQAPVRTEVAAAGLGQQAVMAIVGDNKLPALPLMGTAHGGEYGDIDDDIELTELHINEVLEYLPRPGTMAGDRNAYALTIVGDSMFPRFKPSERVAVSARASVGIGDDVIVQLRGAEGDDERVKMVLIKELVRRTATHVELKQYRPERVFRIETRRVAAMHRVLGNLF